MASLPARQPSQRRDSQRAQSQPSSTHSPVRSRSEDSQTIFVHDSPYEKEQQQQERIQPATRPIAPEDDPSVKRCWICFEDSTEDTPETSPWRDPCPCALVAHEECLLDWIADMEAPKNTRNRSIAAPKIECPQCKSEIKLARPRDYVVDLVRGFERLALKAVAPSAVFMLSGAVYHLTVLHGVHSIYAVFGAQDGARILRPLQMNATRPPLEVYVNDPRTASQQLLRVLMDHAVHWRLYCGIPLITPILLFSRTSLADGILPVLPIVFFASQAHSPDEALDFATWPPSASFAFAVLPYIRSLYNFYYQKVWAEKEKQWLKEIQPRVTQNQGEDGAEGVGGEDQNEGQAAGEDENVFELHIDRGLWENWDDAEEMAENVAPAQDDEAAPGPNVQDNRPNPRGGGNEQAQRNAGQQPQQNQPQQQQQANGNQQNGQVDRRISFSASAIAETAIGAIAFPTLAGLAGEALKLVLPTSWTTPPAPNCRWGSRWGTQTGVKGFLQNKWARSIVGGCLLVVAKDALMLYVRWRMAQMHRGRRVVDFDRKKGDSKKAAV
ncbi:hypothetical protein M409DRAFT_22637 [Zasmidium cellare ATCC 36951]|uniref:RING-CH-type domain-containing protein n=1 Tax=Zasmidium cellare ATCC 36951 TaxID=1080233 RepID=A0A6A6CLW5_ZASCE|nr:uncharacterized protein M409DRAFT_22637 [Zasmidium cellare ATCC 36951]KAF2167208.1 hypothetical protein M409DRAFT_22637 [Zasmidium cellare ATCC 36951]